MTGLYSYYIHFVEVAKVSSSQLNLLQLTNCEKQALLKVLLMLLDIQIKKNFYIASQEYTTGTTTGIESTMFGQKKRPKEGQILET